MLSRVQKDVLISNQPLTVRGITDAFHLAME